MRRCGTTSLTLRVARINRRTRISFRFARWHLQCRELSSLEWDGIRIQERGIHEGLAGNELVQMVGMCPGDEMSMIRFDRILIGFHSNHTILVDLGLTRWKGEGMSGLCRHCRLVENICQMVVFIFWRVACDDGSDSVSMENWAQSYYHSSE